LRWHAYVDKIHNAVNLLDIFRRVGHHVSLAAGGGNRQLSVANLVLDLGQQQRVRVSVGVLPVDVWVFLVQSAVRLLSGSRVLTNAIIAETLYRCSDVPCEQLPGVARGGSLAEAIRVSRVSD
jgi:2-C-methyl-D-erythritol 4-phosphate cytidylyltransferase